jgi:subtilase family serine protease
MILEVGSARSAGNDHAAAASDQVKLQGHVPMVARGQFDAGEASASLKLTGLDITLAKTSGQDADLNAFLAAVNDPHSSLYHHWLTPTQYGQRFGASDATIKQVTDWLQSNGLKAGDVPEGRGHIPFFGSKDKIESAFQTAIHLFRIDGTLHYSNVSAPSVPKALAPVIKAIGGLNDFHPKSGLHKAAPEITLPSSSVLGPNYLGPGDFAVIYNVRPLYQQSLYGQGVTVAIAAQSDINSATLQTYWTAFGVSATQLGLTAAKFSSTAVPTAQGGSDPGETNNGDESEAYLDTELVGGIAPGVVIALVRDKSAAVAAEYVIDNNLAAVLNISFGSCEQAAGADNSKISSLYQQAAAQGITILVSSGDSGVAGCDDTTGVGVKGYAVNALASTPYDIAVGGTEFDLNQLSAQNWSGAALPTLTTALSYIPETVWNESCASPTLTSYFAADLTSPEPVTFCNTPTLGSETNPFIITFGSGGGLSSCVTQDSTTKDCTGGYPQPAWQSGVPGVSGLGARGLPDIALPATHWVTCDQSNATCDPSTLGDFNVEYGTSAAAPAAAAIVALLDQSQITGTNSDGRQGLLADRLYSIAAAQWSVASTLSGCNASLGTSIGGSCVFYDITTGNNDQPCLLSSYASSESLPASTCQGDTGGYGIMVQGSTPAYAAGPGYDLATGLGSLNAANLVGAFNALHAPTGLQAKASGATVTLTWNVVTAATSYNVYQGSASGAESTTPTASATGNSTTITGLQNGQTFYFTIAAVTPYGTSASSEEAPATIVPAAPSGLTASVANNIVTLNWSASSGATSYSVYEGSSSGAEGSTSVQSGLTTTTATVQGLAAGHTYYFTVDAVDGGGASASSSEVSAAIPASGGGGAFGYLEIVGLLSGAAYRWRNTSKLRRGGARPH